MDSRYLPHDHEAQLYQLWEEAGVFNPDRVAQIRKGAQGSDSQQRSFTIVMPPPNANDPLHIGHAMFIALEDIFIRYHRMLGDDTVWIPGTDHAGIETQFVFEKKLKKNGQSRFDFDRETLYQKIWEYVQENSGVAVAQMKKMGASADWSRFKFMLDPDLVSIVLDTFKKLHAENLVYRDVRLVNYCTHCGTSYSELEVNYQDQTTPLYYVKYPLLEKPGEFVTLATVRPEPIFADTHLAVHPDNPKTKHLIGLHVRNPLTDAEMEIIADEFVDPEFGTGVVKLTPAHDPHDFEVAQKHSLPIIAAIDTNGRITEQGGVYAGMKVAAAREAVGAKLKEKGLLDHVDTKYQNRVGTCYRCGRILEILPLPQFFIKVKPLTEPVLKGLEEGEFVVHGAGHDKILRHWLENLKDWNISRQIVWGIKIPVWYETQGYEDKITVGFLNREGTFTVLSLQAALDEGYTLSEIISQLQSTRADATVPYSLATEAPGENYIPETDTFDTWFSSAQWPFSTLQALSKQAATQQDFERFYPTSVMETGYDILPFWVMRMLMMGKYTTGKFPFETIYLHGLVRDAQGQKMSKSKGNVTNPLEIIEQYGADALRMALVIRSSAGLDKSVGEADFKAARNLTNKIWNAARFISLQTAEPSQEEKPQDQAFKTHLAQVVTQVSQQLTDYKPGLAADTLYNEFWHWFCDECIEAQKNNQLSLPTLKAGLEVFLKLLHPFMPFVTEAVWQTTQPKTSLAVAEWPTPEAQ